MKYSNMKNVAFIDDHERFRTVISKYLNSPPIDYQVYQYENGQDFITRFPLENYTPDIVLMDIRMSPMNGYDTTKWIKENYPTIPILAFSDIVDIDAIKEISRCGANGCADKTLYGSDNLKEVFESIMEGGTYYDSIEISKMVKIFLSKDKSEIHEGFSSLTNKETEVFKFAGDDDKTIEEKAEALGITKATYNKHTSNLYRKLNIKKASSLQKIAYRLGLIDK